MATKTKRTRKPRAKQTYIEGTAPPSVPAIEAAADAYRDARDDRMAQQKVEVELQDKLLAVMHEHNLTTYSYESYVVTVAPKEKVSVRRAPGSNGEASVE